MAESESPALPLRLWQYPTAASDPRQMISSGASAQEKLGQKGQWPLGPHCITPRHNRHSLLIEFIEVLVLRAVLAHAQRHFLLAPPVRFHGTLRGLLSLSSRSYGPQSLDGSGRGLSHAQRC